MSIKTVVILKNYFFVLLNFTAESVNFFFEKSKKNIFAIRLTKKNFVTHIENLPQQLLEKFIGDNSSITDIASRN